jgi:Ca-activated chloride channel homolog
VKHNYKWISFATLAAFLVRGSFWEVSVTAGKSQEPAVRIEPRQAPSGPALGSANRQTPTIRINTDLVIIPVMVTDRNDRAVTGLERDHFRLWEDKVEQTITHFSAEDVPVSIVFAFDVSGSMARKLGLARLAVDQFLDKANPEDEFALVSFDDQVHLVQPFTINHEEIQSRMLLLAAKGRTALLDAIVLSMDQMKHARHSRKVILIVSDGGDNSSRYSLKDVRTRAREADVQIYSIGIQDPMWIRNQVIEQLTGAALLSDMASQTGGRLYEIEDANQLPDVTARIGIALRNQYVLGYVPSADKRDGKYHRVQVKVERPAGVAKLRATFRSGYTASSN